MGNIKVNIVATMNGQPKGFVKSISYNDGTFKMTKSRKNAKGYTSRDAVQSDIDFLTKFNFDKGYIFLYN